jgi:hypothetical protein
VIELSVVIAAMNFAVKNGHLDVIKWLHENISEGCTYHAINLAVIEWVYDNKNEVCLYN